MIDRGWDDEAQIEKEKTKPPTVGKVDEDAEDDSGSIVEATKAEMKAEKQMKANRREGVEQTDADLALCCHLSSGFIGVQRLSCRLRRHLSFQVLGAVGFGFVGWVWLLDQNWV